MARKGGSFGFEKRQKELKKQKKRQEKLDRKRNKGVLYFKHGKLVDAVCNSLRGEPAAIESIAWENVLLNLKPLPKMTFQSQIESDLTSLILESLKRKDESV
mgnify:CR=1 FL=1